MDNSVFQQNIIALSSINPELAFSISQTKSSDNIKIEKSKDGSSVPVLTENSGRFQLHSLYNPVKEGGKLFQINKANSGFVIIFGLGAGYHIFPYIDDQRINSILIIDKNKEYLRKLIENIDLSRIFSSRKVDFLLDPDFDELQKNLCEKYNPSIHGDLKISHLANRVISEQEFFNKITADIRTVIESISDDFASQAQFGKRWFKNTLYNLEFADKYSKPVPPAKKVLVAGAGPSLENQISHLLKHKEDSILISTDTALPFLFAREIVPDLIISIDCQHITYNHFLGLDIENIPVILDLSSPVHLSRKFRNRVYFSSGHPFSRYLATYWKFFPAIDTSGGNVGHSAVSLAHSLGASQVYLYGLDYSYPGGKPYAKNSLLYSYYMNRESRLSPATGSVYSFVFSNTKNRKINNSVITNSKLDSYHDRLKDFIKLNNISTESAPLSPRDLSFNFQPPDSRPVFFGSGSSSVSWKTFLEDYMIKLKELPEVGDIFNNYYQSLSKKEKELWATVFPVCASIRKEYRDKELKTSFVLNAGRKWCIDTIRSVLNNK